MDEAGMGIGKGGAAEVEVKRARHPGPCLSSFWFFWCL